MVLSKRETGLKEASTTNSGYNEYLIIPYGLAGSRSVFHAFDKLLIIS